MFLIMSGAYVGTELQSEFGQIPPSFLPLGNRRLFQHQIALIPEGVNKYLSIPESFTLSEYDQLWLDENNVSIVTVPVGLNLGASLVAAVNISGNSLDSPLHVLYGDTLFSKLPTGDDIASVSEAMDDYNWAMLSKDKAGWLKSSQLTEGDNKIIDGYFKFSRPRDILRYITQSEWDFIEGLNRYHHSVGITPVESTGWLDFGHVNTYYRSKAKHTTQRAFNELKINSRWIEKASVKNDKIAAEANWFATLPEELRGYTPQYLGSQVKDKVSYRLEYLHLTALNELFVFSKVSSPVWKSIFKECVNFLKICSRFNNSGLEPVNTLDILFGEKTEERLSQYCKEESIELDSEWFFNGQRITLQQILDKSYEYLPLNKRREGVLHGDFCFSNILYDFRAGKIKAIDPRGMTPDGLKTIYGDINYDLAKLSHSVLGLYDWIIAGYYKVSIQDNHIKFSLSGDYQHQEIQQIFIELVEKNFDLSSKNLFAMQIQLFLSMLPLHSDDKERQKALFANSFRLYQILLRLEK
ncbi:capsular biosynthesis protein [Vibrio vulnificus]|nr:capsular biosynthesis protein [Vibrio vulnificus]